MAEAEQTLESAKTKEARGSSWFNKVPTKIKLFVGLGIIIYLYNRSQKGLGPEDYVLALGIGFVILYLFGKEPSRSNDMLLEPEAYAIAKEWMQNKIDTMQFPLGTEFDMYGLSALSYYSDAPDMYGFGCDITYPNKLTLHYNITMSAFPPGNPTLQEAFGKFDGRKKTVIIRPVVEDFAKNIKKYPEIFKKF